MNDPAAERIDAHLDAVDIEETADRDALIAIFVETAARRGITVEVGERGGFDFLRVISTPCRDSTVGLIVSGPPITNEVLSDLISLFENAKDPIDPMNIYSTDLFKYLAGDMIGQNQITLTIANVTLEKMNSGRGGEQAKPCLHFVEREKLMVLNKSNAAAIAKELGVETDIWRGATVALAVENVKVGRNTVPSVRVKSATPAKGKPAPAAPVNGAEQGDGIDGIDDHDPQAAPG